MQIANNNQVEDWELSGKIENIDFSGDILELKYALKSGREIKQFILNKQRIKQKVLEIKNSMKFSKIICRFDFGKFFPSEQEQKDLIDFQTEVYDEVTMQMIDGNFDMFKVIFEYALNNSKIPVSTLIDINQHPDDLAEYSEYLRIMKPSNTRWIYHKIDTNLQKYRTIAGILSKAGIDYFLIGCRLRCSIKNFENIDVSVIARGYFSFKGCCLEYAPNKQNKKGKKIGFSPTMNVFNAEICEWERAINKDYKKNRIGNYLKLNKRDTSFKVLEKIPKIKLLFEHLNEL